ncbi:glucose-6-phosphate isomerase family protein [Pedobacter heparinus]|uniref:glucose-6-phosphate isomerase family protein n=1 Tax=Pedobacter heparinus TaxID=984 RepID=UPI00292D527B|nr:glucose-6-phosphate isomerase family protein [Pedobacter heparinus]
MILVQDGLKGDPVIRKSTTISDLKNLFKDEQLRSEMPQDQIIYDVEAYLPISEGTEGGLFFGVTRIYPGKVGDEYFMTRGHFHALSDRGEFYFGTSGCGRLILMTRDRKIRQEEMHPGSIHYIPAHTAHRVSNTGNDVLSFSACWPSDAGHDYDEIVLKGFSGCLIDVDGKPELIIKESYA